MKSEDGSYAIHSSLSLSEGVKLGDCAGFSTFPAKGKVRPEERASFGDDAGRGFSVAEAMVALKCKGPWGRVSDSVGALVIDGASIDVFVFGCQRLTAAVTHAAVSTAMPIAITVGTHPRLRSTTQLAFAYDRIDSQPLSFS